MLKAIVVFHPFYLWFSYKKLKYQRGRQIFAHTFPIGKLVNDNPICGSTFTVDWGVTEDREKKEKDIEKEKLGERRIHRCKSKGMQSNLCTTTTLGTPNMWPFVDRFSLFRCRFMCLGLQNCGRCRQLFGGGR